VSGSTYSFMTRAHGAQRGLCSMRDRQCQMRGRVCRGHWAFQGTLLTIKLYQDVRVIANSRQLLGGATRLLHLDLARRVQFKDSAGKRKILRRVCMGTEPLIQRKMGRQGSVHLCGCGDATGIRLAFCLPSRTARLFASIPWRPSLRVDHERLREIRLSVAATDSQDICLSK